MPAILLVDDDDLFADMLGRMVVRAGCEIIRARHGREALQLFDPAVIDLVLTDVLMPDMEGLELIMALRSKHPTVKIIAMSGGGRNRPDTYLSVARHLGATRVLAKPFTSEELFAVIREVLGSVVFTGTGLDRQTGT